MTAEVKVYSTTFCPYCVRAKQLLERKGVAFTEINLDNEAPEVKVELMQKTKQRTVPQIFIGNTHVGGCDDLIALDQAGGLLPLLHTA